MDSTGRATMENNNVNTELNLESEQEVLSVESLDEGTNAKEAVEQTDESINDEVIIADKIDDKVEELNSEILTEPIITITNSKERIIPDSFLHDIDNFELETEQEITKRRRLALKLGIPSNTSHNK
jgi:hypothetical protein